MSVELPKTDDNLNNEQFNNRMIPVIKVPGAEEDSTLTVSIGINRMKRRALLCIKCTL